jgi:CheY-like chemotaxis protein
MNPDLLPAVASSQGETRLLIVDDSPQLLNALVLAARSSGMFASVVSAASARLAMQMLGRPTPKDSSALPNVILIDLYMPELNGVELLAALLRDTELRSVRRVIMSEWDDPIERNAAYQAGCDAFVRKPSSGGSFTTILRTVLWACGLSPTAPSARATDGGTKMLLHAIPSAGAEKCVSSADRSVR